MGSVLKRPRSNLKFNFTGSTNILRIILKNIKNILYIKNKIVMKSVLHELYNNLYTAERRIRNNPYLDSNYLAKGIVLHQLTRYQEAIIYFKHVLTMNEFSYEAYIHLADSYEELKDVESAYKNFEKSITLLQKYIKFNMEKGNFDKAKILNNRLISLIPDFSGAYYNKAIIDIQKSENLENILKALNNAIKLKFPHLEVYLYKCLILFELQRYEKAMTECKTFLKMKENMTIIDKNNKDKYIAYVYNIKGRCELKLGKYKLALDSFENYSKYTKEEDFNYYNSKAICLYQLGRNEDALYCYNQAVLIAPDNCIVLNNRAGILMIMNKQVLAYVDIKKCKEVMTTCDQNIPESAKNLLITSIDEKRKILDRGN